MPLQATGLCSGGDATANPELSWEYWNGSGWWRLNINSDGTRNLKSSGTVTFEVPGDLKAVDWAGKTNHWIRARLIGGDYGRENVVVKTKTTGSTSTEQTILRSSEGIQPPFALAVRVTYQIIKETIPKYLLTEDSGTLRDQSDANRTPGTELQVFTPLAYILSHIEAPSGSANAENGSKDCVPDCGCRHGTASASPAQNAAQISDDYECMSGAEAFKSVAPDSMHTAASTDSRAMRPALYLGFSSKLSGEPINLLLAIDQERNHDKLAPLSVDA
ncbi:MAG: hypothetical protein HC848_08110, partial [Limnobacter sp.]|nr:hypothetical protein [Limnobacter sp.]